MKRLVGSYSLRGIDVEVYLRSGQGANFTSRGGKRKKPQIEVGADDKWHCVFTGVLHEALEMCSSMMECRFEPDKALESGDCFTIIVNHPQFSALCEHVGYFLACCTPDLGNAYRAWNKNKK